MLITMPYLRIWIHLVWSTKKRAPFLNSQIRQEIFHHMQQNALDKGIFLAEINGFDDHVHCLVSLKNTQSVSTVVQMIKGESSFWINQQELIPDRFEWQTEYYAVSVGESEVARIRHYIRKQESHHQQQSFQLEERVLVKKYGFVLEKGG